MNEGYEIERRGETDFRKVRIVYEGKPGGGVYLSGDAFKDINPEIVGALVEQALGKEEEKVKYAIG